MSPLELRRGGERVWCVGHRGAAALAPENSLAAIDAAAAHGADAVELDVLRRGDGSLVLGHDEEAAHLDGAPLLDEALALAARLGLAVQIDVKLAGVEAGCVEALRRHDLLDRAFVSSPSAAILRAWAVAAPGLPRSLSYPDDRRGLSQRRLVAPAVRPALAVLRELLPRRLPGRLRATGARAATLNWFVVTPAVVAVCHGLDVAVYAWTVNDPALARSLVESGIDGIITDDPRIDVRGSRS